MENKHDIVRMEELFLNTWPTLETKLYDGWVLRFARGYTKRSNSIHPLYPNLAPLEHKMEKCEKFYAEEGLPLIFKMTEMSQPADLDEFLGNRGYDKIDQTLVMHLNLDKWDFEESGDIIYSRNNSVKWMDSFCEFAKLSEEQRVIFGNLLRLNGEKNLYTVLCEGEEVVGCGLGVVKTPIAGIFSVIIRENERGKGFGRKLLGNMLSKIRSLGVEDAYLQVTESNENAIKLYDSFGFKELYKYWYRKKV